MQHQNLFVFDIETIPDIKTAKNLLHIDSEEINEIRNKLTKYHLDLTDQKNNLEKKYSYVNIMIIV